MAEHGALGTLKKTLLMNGVSYISTPKRIAFGEQHNVMNITCGYGFTAFAIRSSDTNILYGSGINTDSQLGENKTIADIYMNLYLRMLYIEI